LRRPAAGLEERDAHPRSTGTVKTTPRPAKAGRVNHPRNAALNAERIDGGPRFSRLVDRHRKSIGCDRAIAI